MTLFFRVSFSNGECVYLFACFCRDGPPLPPLLTFCFFRLSLAFGDRRDRESLCAWWTSPYLLASSGTLFVARSSADFPPRLSPAVLCRVDQIFVSPPADSPQTFFDPPPFFPFCFRLAFLDVRLVLGHPRKRLLRISSFPTRPYSPRCRFVLKVATAFQKSRRVPVRRSSIMPAGV